MYSMPASWSRRMFEQLIGSQPEHPLSTVQQHVAWENSAWRLECNRVHNSKTLEDRLAVRIAPVAELPYTAVIVPLAADGRLHLTARYRYAIGRWSIEFPRLRFEGGDAGWRAAAEQDLFEMTGLVADKWSLLGAVHVDPTILSSSAVILLAEGCRPAASGRRKAAPAAPSSAMPVASTDPTPEDPPEGASVGVADDTRSLVAGSVELPLAELLNLIRGGDIACGPTLAALSLYRATLG